LRVREVSVRYPEAMTLLVDQGSCFQQIFIPSR
jgi:hypothetical protein